MVCSRASKLFLSQSEGEDGIGAGQLGIHVGFICPTNQRALMNESGKRIGQLGV